MGTSGCASFIRAMPSGAARRQRKRISLAPDCFSSETAAEIDRLERDGATMVGMTGMPEAALARELDLAYAAIAVVANHAAGRGASRDSIQLDDIRAVMEHALARVRNILEHLVECHGHS